MYLVVIISKCHEQLFMHMWVQVHIVRSCSTYKRNHRVPTRTPNECHSTVLIVSGVRLNITVDRAVPSSQTQQNQMPFPNPQSRIDGSFPGQVKVHVHECEVVNLSMRVSVSFTAMQLVYRRVVLFNIVKLLQGWWSVYNSSMIHPAMIPSTRNPSKVLDQQSCRILRLSSRARSKNTQSIRITASIPSSPCSHHSCGTVDRFVPFIVVNNVRTP